MIPINSVKIDESCDIWISRAPVERKKELSILEKVERMVDDPLTQALAKEHGMVVQNVSWEDTARTKNSSWGPNISDMTLQVKDGKQKDHRLPVIRQPNFSDKTWDVSLNQFFVEVGNEKGEGVLKRISLREYLEHFSDYLRDGSVKGSLLAERDTHVIHSVQACFLPAREGEEVDFNVALYNYQTYKGNPAVLTIVASSHGASAQIIDNGDNYRGEKLSFDKNGTSCDFAASRLKDVRMEHGMAIEGSLNIQEQENRKLQIIQIPLKVAPWTGKGIYYESCMEGALSLCAMGLESASIDDAQIRVGKKTGTFKGVKGLTIERDPQYPIRVTTQLYKITDDGCINREQMEQIAAEIKKEETIGQKGSSLVMEQTNRPTEWVKV